MINNAATTTMSAIAPVTKLIALFVALSTTMLEIVVPLKAEKRRICCCGHNIPWLAAKGDTTGRR